MKLEEPENREDKIDKFLNTMTWYHSEKREPTGFYHAIGDIRKHLETLNRNIEEANDSSSNLTAALNKITLAGVIIAGLGLIVATINIFKG